MYVYEGVCCGETGQGLLRTAYLNIVQYWDLDVYFSICK